MNVSRSEAKLIKETFRQVGVTTLGLVASGWEDYAAQLREQARHADQPGPLTASAVAADRVAAHFRQAEDGHRRPGTTEIMTGDRD